MPPKDVVTVQDLQDFDQQVLKGLGGVGALIQRLGVNESKGLSQKQIHQNREKFGSNSLPEPDVQSFWEFLQEALFEDTTLIILELSALVQLLFAWFVRYEGCDSRR
mgnify:CR=1 FL=1